MIDGAGTDLPQGEFYQSEPVARVLRPELSALTASAMTWHTTAGVAAYRTEWVLLAARRDAIVWDLWLSGAEPEPVLDLTVTLALDITGRAISDDLFDALPDKNDVPDGMFLEERMSPNGIFDAQGTPIPMSERIGSR